jgi:hypothetical protein
MNTDEQMPRHPIRDGTRAGTLVRRRESNPDEPPIPLVDSLDPCRSVKIRGKSPRLLPSG